MNSRRRAFRLAAFPLLIFCVVAWSPAGRRDMDAAAQAPRVPDGLALQYQFQVLHGFGAEGDGVAAGGPLAMDSMGNIYGVTEGGGEYNHGTVYELSPNGNGQWTETILHSFPYGDPSDGWQPSGLVIDSAGDLYGTTEFGGDGQYCGSDFTCGTVFEMSPTGNGIWTETILWNFCSLPDCADGVSPAYAPSLGPGGVLYGIAAYAAYQLTPGPINWTYNHLYTFCTIGNNCTGGASPSSGLTLDPKGNLYGETLAGGKCIIPEGCGVAYVLRPQPTGQWEELVLHDFQMQSTEDGGGPQGGLTFYDVGLFGVAHGGGSNCVPSGGCGVVFELTKGSGKNISEQVIWNFGADGGAQGVGPISGVTFDKGGDLFGVTAAGGKGCGVGCGVAYGMMRQKSGKWAYQVLHTFNGSDGVEPDGVLTVDSKGNLYGATGGGGPNGGGEVFELSPVTSAK